MGRGEGSRSILPYYARGPRKGISIEKRGARRLAYSKKRAREAPLANQEGVMRGGGLCSKSVNWPVPCSGRPEAQRIGYPERLPMGKENEGRGRHRT